MNTMNTETFEAFLGTPIIRQRREGCPIYRNEHECSGNIYKNYCYCELMNKFTLHEFNYMDGPSVKNIIKVCDTFSQALEIFKLFVEKNGYTYAIKYQCCTVFEACQFSDNKYDVYKYNYNVDDDNNDNDDDNNDNNDDNNDNNDNDNNNDNDDNNNRIFNLLTFMNRQMTQ